MIKRNIYSYVGWRSYLDHTNNLRVQRFLEINGRKILPELVSEIDVSISKRIGSFLLLVHPNASSIILIESKDYMDILQHCLDYFIENELFELCDDVIKVQNKFKRHIRKHRELIPKVLKR